jgi:hypothetical protein
MAVSRGAAMTFIERIFRLTNEAGGLGLSCTVAGLSLAGVPLLRKTKAGFAPRPTHEIRALAEAAFRSPADATRLSLSLDVIAGALNRGDVAHAMIAAVLTRPLALSWSEAARLAKAEDELTKYDPEEPRDWHGRWTNEGSDSPNETAADRPASNTASTSSTPVPIDPDGSAADTPDDNETELEKKYDYLNPVDFSKKVIEFGYRLETEGKNFTPAEREAALAEYSFLQNRLSYWLSYEYTPVEAQANLRSSAFSLYSGAVNGGIVPVGGNGGDLPPSMLTVVTGPLPVEGSSPIISSRGVGGAAVHEDEFAPPAATTTEEATEGPSGTIGPPTPPSESTGEIGGVIDNTEAEIRWGGPDIKRDQGEPWEKVYGKNNPDAIELSDNSKGFDHYHPNTGEDVSNKTLNTFCYSYTNDPRRVYNKLKYYIDATADYRPRNLGDLAVGRINSKTIHLAVPENTSPAQWHQIDRATQYGTSRGISVVTTRIRG